MDRVTLQNYRCFREKQSARLAPLTFLVGENSTGKTSFLALLRALWQVAFQDMIPDFRQPPYDLGSFEDIVHYRNFGSGTPDSFQAGFEYSIYDSHTENPYGFTYCVSFDNQRGYAFPSKRTIFNKDAWFELNATDPQKGHFRFGSSRMQSEQPQMPYQIHVGDGTLFPFGSMLGNVEKADDHNADESFITRLREVLWTLSYPQMFTLTRAFPPPFASAPIRSRPKRTYDPSRPTQDPEGEYIPDYFASMSRNEPEDWERLKSNLEDFGRESGLFDEIAVLSFGKTAGSPFQVQIRKFGKRLKGPKRNLIDVGYGVSQALPILTELLREDSPKMFLLQQPEVHLHPRAQAALGSLFCNLAASGKQIVVETHSDYILDRARMDIRDGRTDLKPDDISVLYFERDELDVNIHSLGVDEDGNVLDAPLGYGQFFMDEMRRSVGL